MYAIGVTLAVTALVAPRTSVVNQAPLIIPLFLLFASMARSGRWGQAAVALIQVGLVGGLWAFDLLCFPAPSSGEHWHAQQELMLPVLPVLSLVALELHSRWWSKSRGVA
jgi:hypothetical protein